MVGEDDDPLVPLKECPKGRVTPLVVSRASADLTGLHFAGDATIPALLLKSRRRSLSAGDFKRLAKLISADRLDAPPGYRAYLQCRKRKLIFFRLDSRSKLPPTPKAFTTSA